MFVPSQSLSYDGHPADGAISLGRSRSNPGVAAWPGSRVSRDSGLPTLSRVTIFLKNPPCGKQTRQIYACPQVQPRFPHMPHFLPRSVSSSAPEKLVQSSKCALMTTETSILKMQTERFKCFLNSGGKAIFLNKCVS